MKIECQIEPDEFTNHLSGAFDYEFTGKSEFELPQFKCPKSFSIGMIVGASGSGKSQILKNYLHFVETPVVWDNSKAIVSNFSGKTPDEVTEVLFAVGLGSIPALCKPYRVLSNGEKFRADIARQLVDGAIIDEFTSVVNRETAKSLSYAMAKYIRTKGLKNIVLASCHRDIIQWVEPDWVFDCDKGATITNELRMNLFGEMVDSSQKKRVARIELL